MTYDPRQFPGQYPSPYTAPDPAASAYYGYQAGFDPAAPLKVPARRAGLLMIISGIFMLLCGGCASLMFSMLLNPPPMSGPQAAEFAQKRTQVLAELKGRGFDPHTAVTTGWVLVVVGIVFAAMGFVVRRGNRTFMRLAIVLDGILTLLQAIGLLQLVLELGRSASPTLFLMILVQAVPLVIYVMIFVLLIRGLKNQNPLALAQQQYQQQMWQYQQQQQMYAQGYYPPAYGPIPPPAGSQQTPPSVPPRDTPPGGAS